MKIIIGILAAVVAFAGFFTAIWGDTKVALKEEGGVLYRQIKNGRVAVNCYNENGAKIIAPSRFFGPEWVKVISLNDIPKEL